MISAMARGCNSSRISKRKPRSTGPTGRLGSTRPATGEEIGHQLAQPPQISDLIKLARLVARQAADDLIRLGGDTAK